VLSGVGSQSPSWTTEASEEVSFVLTTFEPQELVSERLEA
jgi:hypothetical protein